MARIFVAAAAAAGLALLGAAPATAAEAPAPQVFCGASGLQAGLLTRLCAEVDGDQVQLVGRISLAGPPSPGSPGPRPQDLQTVLTGENPAGTAYRDVRFTGATVEVRGVGGPVPCAVAVHGSFAVASYPWAPRPVTVDLPASC
ncbi:hypothetical protein GCM10010441_20760 [Kitasatospora paracochleata]|uniref:Secreted protein n=1 Tax=Kitasatospora paracochleata TaxID=58354 RepID=A0ABT1J7Y3_9ACTN|nr:hypothetical protein [Kitasatospora paracochleata]MCP2313547.1 hypothetical protein [Kitasatospora paracochleata]